MKRVRRTAAPGIKVDAILTADWHLRDDKPICRTDDFMAAQIDKMRQISDIQKEFECPVLHAGDLFHHWKPSPYLLAIVIKELPCQFYTVYGNHDLPQHNWELRNKSGINALEAAGVLTVLDSDGWNQLAGVYIENKGLNDLAIWHKFVWDGKKIPWPDCDEMTALEVLKKYPDYDMIVTGDHHKPFTQEYKGRLLVNPGCLTRQAADYAEHRPRVYLYNAEDNFVVPHYMDVQGSEVVSSEHIKRSAERNERLEAFISRLDLEYKTSISFEENLKRFFRNNNVRKEVEQLTYKAIEDE